MTGLRPTRRRSESESKASKIVETSPKIRFWQWSLHATYSPCSCDATRESSEEKRRETAKLVEARQLKTASCQQDSQLELAQRIQVTPADISLDQLTMAIIFYSGDGGGEGQADPGEVLPRHRDREARADQARQRCHQMS